MLRPWQLPTASRHLRLLLVVALAGAWMLMPAGHSIAQPIDPPEPEWQKLMMDNDADFDVANDGALVVLIGEFDNNWPVNPYDDVIIITNHWYVGGNETGDPDYVVMDPLIRWPSSRFIFMRGSQNGINSASADTANSVDEELVWDYNEDPYAMEADALADPWDVVAIAGDNVGPPTLATKFDFVVAHPRLGSIVAMEALGNYDPDPLTNDLRPGVTVEDVQTFGMAGTDMLAPSALIRGNWVNLDYVMPDPMVDDNSEFEDVGVLDWGRWTDLVPDTPAGIDNVLPKTALFLNNHAGGDQYNGGAFSLESPAPAIALLDSQPGGRFCAKGDYDPLPDGGGGTIPTLDTGDFVYGPEDGTNAIYRVTYTTDEVPTFDTYNLPVDTNAGNGVAADFNGDGQLDAAFCTSNGVAVLLNSNNNFNSLDNPLPAFFITTNASPSGHGIATDDLNGDGELDLAVVTLEQSAGQFTYFLEFLWGRGDGSFVRGASPLVVTNSFVGGPPDLPPTPRPVLRPRVGIGNFRGLPNNNNGAAPDILIAVNERVPVQFYVQPQIATGDGALGPYTIGEAVNQELVTLEWAGGIATSPNGGGGSGLGAAEVGSGQPGVLVSGSVTTTPGTYLMEVQIDPGSGGDTVEYTIQVTNEVDVDRSTAPIEPIDGTEDYADSNRLLVFTFRVDPVYTGAADVEVTNMRFTESGTLLASHINSATVWYDLDNSGTVDPAFDVELGNTVVSELPFDVVLDSAFPLPTTGANFLLTYDLNGTAAAGTGSRPQLEDVSGRSTLCTPAQILVESANGTPLQATNPILLESAQNTGGGDDDDGDDDDDDGFNILGIGCFVVTASAEPGSLHIVNDAGMWRVNGAGLDDIRLLRRFRDDCLAQSAAGRSVIDAYNHLGPSAAVAIESDTEARGVVRLFVIAPARVVAMAATGDIDSLRATDATGLLMLLLYIAGSVWLVRRIVTRR